MQKYTVKNLTATKKLAAKIAGQVKNGGVIGLIGNLGAGKTTFTQLLAQVMGVKQVVNSPTFNIIKVYKIKNQKSKTLPTGRQVKNLVHIDAYRLHSPEELTALGVEEYFNNAQTVTIIEWADKVKKILPKKTMVITIKLNRGNTRQFKITTKK